MIVSVHLPATGSFREASAAEPFLGVGLTLPPDVLAELLVMHDGRAERVPSGPGLAVARAPAELIDALVRLLRLIDHPRDAPVLGPLVRREILWRVLTGEQGHLLRRVGGAARGVADVAAAIHHLREHHAEALRISDLAAVAGVGHEVGYDSPSQFNREYKQLFGVPPGRDKRELCSRWASEPALAVLP